MKNVWKPKVVILAGGKGLRLKELTNDTPKCMLKVGNKLMIEHIMDSFKDFGYDEFIIAAGYKKTVIGDFFSVKNGVEVVDTGLETKTGSRLLSLKKLLIKEPYFFVCYADGLANVDLKEFELFHKKNKRVASMVVTKPVSRFGVVDIKGGLVTKFVEKPVLPYLINAGFFIFNQRIFNYLNTEMFEEATLPHLALRGELSAFEHTGFWKCMDTFKDWSDFNKLNKERPWDIRNINS